MQDKYLSVWNTMEDDKWYTAKELGMAAASMSAMVRRGLVVDRAGKPKQYKKMANALIKILEILKDKDFEYFILYKTDRPLGMLCSLKNGQVLDCWEQPYDLTNVYKLVVKHQEFAI